MNLILTGNEELTMSSEQLADLLELRHDNVRRSALNLESHGTISFTQHSVKGKGRDKKVLQFDKRNSMVMAAKLNDKLLAAVIDRWMELEEKEQPEYQIPQTFSEAMQLAADSIKQLEEQAPKIAVYEQLADRKGDISTTLLAKQLGTTAIQLNKFLRKSGVKMLRIDAPKAGYVDWFNVVSGCENDHEFTQCLITPLGQIEIAECWSSE
jgi:anti-repressor protein